MMDEWSNWVVDSDPAEMVRQMRGVLADRRRSHDEKLEALTLLTNLASEDSLDVLRWYQEHADPGLEIASLLALHEANLLNRPPSFEPWHETLLDLAHEIASPVDVSGKPDQTTLCDRLEEACRAEGWHVSRGGRALLKYDGILIDMLPIDLIVNHRTLVGVWELEDVERAWREIDQAEDGEMVVDALEAFYALLRTANLPWGVLVDVSGRELITDLVENLELDRGTPRVEYVLAVPGG